MADVTELILDAPKNIDIAGAFVQMIIDNTLLTGLSV
jgi:hypothetical protein